jgi:hypothetical protein
VQAGRSWSLLVAVVLAAVLPSSAMASRASGEGFPIFESSAFYHSLGKVDHLLLDVRNLEDGATPESVAFAAPMPYRLAKIDPTLDMLSVVAKSTRNGGKQSYTGSLGPGAAHGPGTVSKTCSPGARGHWSAKLTPERTAGSGSGGAVDAPVSFRRVASYSELVVCLDAFKAADLRPTEVLVGVSFHTPSAAGTYVLSAVVFPFAAAGGPDASQGYEMRAVEALPLTMTAKATYSTSSGTLTISGRVMIEHKPWSGTDVQIVAEYPPPTPPPSTELGAAVVHRDGTYVLTAKTSTVPPKVGTYIQSLDEPRCGRAPPIAPKGCRSESLDGIQKNGITVVTTG